MIVAYKTLLFDIDDTLLNFTITEANALQRIFAQYEIPYIEENILAYKSINQELWTNYELGKIDQDAILHTRFQRFLALHGFHVDGIAVDQQYREYLAQGHDLMDGAKELLDQLHGHFDLYVVTNGILDMQHRRLHDAGLHHYFKDIFVSEETGYKKPMKEFFDYVFARIPDFELQNTVIIGDRLSADVLGGHNAGIDSMWLNSSAKPNTTSIQPTYTIHHLHEILGIVNVLVK